MKQTVSFKKLRETRSKLLLIAIVLFGSVVSFQAVNNLQADGPINVWWPTNGAQVSNTQAFKAKVQDKEVSDYKMTWSVDGGQQNAMYDSSVDYPHKEAMVNLDNWTWKGAGPYKITFKAVGKDGKDLGETTIEINTTVSAQGPVDVETPVNIVTETSNTDSSNNQSNQSVTDVVKSVVSKSLGIGSASAEAVAPKVSAAFPTSNADVYGINTFKARLDGTAPDKYTMYWQVDGGVNNAMSTVGDYKEASVDTTYWQWRSNKQYTITFVAKDSSGKELSKVDVPITVGKGTQTTSSPTPNPTPNPTPSVTAAPKVEITPVKLSPSPTPVAQTQAQPAQSNQTNSGNPFSGQKLYVNGNNDAARTVREWSSSRPADAEQMKKVASAPEVTWLGGWYGDIGKAVSDKMSEVKAQGAMPVFVAYNIPQRDCGQYSAGGVGSADEYRNWIRSIANSIGSDKAVVIMEPDALTLTDCLGSRVSERYQLMKDAIGILKSKPNIAVYLDAGHSSWIAADEMANRLRNAGVEQANGFSLNTSNFFTTADNIAYGEKVSGKIGGKHFLVDTGRNGSGPTSDHQWCNPSGRTLGAKPTGNTGHSLVDAFLWVKGPGGSDGNCNGAPSAGVWWPEYALEMARRSY
ncbi:MAG: glycoside hydrolase family 6 protein [bacterium]|nr:glycoside hydrolase family 6 protein [bacterium]